MTDGLPLIGAIRFADTAFPSGGFAFSSGLEGSHRDGFVCDEADVTAFAIEQLVDRWHRCDRVLLYRSWAEHDPAGTDVLAEALSTMSVLREASRRAGAAALATFAQLVEPEFIRDVQGYRARVLAGSVPGHLPIAQAVCFRAAGLTLDTAATVSAWQVVSGISSAALRLGIVGHIGAQRILAASTPVLRDVLGREPPSAPATFTAYADIAAQRRGHGARLFAS